MKILIKECKKIMDIRVLLVIAVFTVLFYQLFLEVTIYPAGGQTTNSPYDMPFYAELIESWGTSLPHEDWSKLDEKRKELEEAYTRIIAADPVLADAKITNYQEFSKTQETFFDKDTLTDEEKNRVCGLIINKFRGDKTILDPGIQMLEERGGVPVTGVVPYMDVQLEDEDSLTERFDKKTDGLIDIAVIRYPRISNFTDFNVFEQMSEVTVRYVSTVNELRHPDIVFLPGSKNTMGDLLWMRQNGLEAAVKKLSCEIPVFGICGGYQMLGASIADPDGVEEGGFMRGMELLPIDTVLKDSKTRLQTSGEIAHVDGVLSRLSGCHFLGYEIHMGKSAYSAASDEQGACADRKNELNNVISDGRNVYGSYIHGIFDTAEAARVIVDYIADKKGIDVNDSAILSYKSFKEKQYDRLADTLREYLDMDAVYGMLREARHD